jgi:hypothetical protein
LLVICTTEFCSCLNIVLRDKGLEEEEELVLWEDEVLEFIRCCCVTAVDGSINPFNGIIINPATAMTVASANSFLIGYAHTYEQTIYRIPGVAVAALGIAVSTPQELSTLNIESHVALPNPIAVRMDIIATASTECISGTVVWNIFRSIWIKFRGEYFSSQYQIFQLRVPLITTAAYHIEYSLFFIICKYPS